MQLSTPREAGASVVSLLGRQIIALKLGVAAYRSEPQFWRQEENLHTVITISTAGYENHL